MAMFRHGWIQPAFADAISMFIQAYFECAFCFTHIWKPAGATEGIDYPFSITCHSVLFEIVPKWWGDENITFF